jgi:uncharacterized protein involved in exopolysaccharide biosynthesis
MQATTVRPFFGTTKTPSEYQLAILRSREPLRQALASQGLQVMVSFNPPKPENAEWLTVKAFSNEQVEAFSVKLNELAERQAIPGLKKGPNGTWSYQASGNQAAVPLKIHRMPDNAK